MEGREEIIQLGNVTPNNWGDQANQGRVYDSNGLSPALNSMQGGGRQPHVVAIEKLGYIDKGNGKHESNEVVSSNGLCPTLCAGTGVKFWVNHLEVEKMEQTIVAMRGRENQGNGYTQHLEPNNDGTSNTITTVEKDNLVMEKEFVAIDEQNRCIRNDTFGTLMADGSSPKHNNRVGEIKTIKIRQATKDGFTEILLGGVANLDYPTSDTRRGRVQGMGQVSPTLTTENIPSLIEEGDEEFYNFLYEIDGDIYLIRIRKLIPLETWRLMGFSNEDFYKAEQVNSNTQLYKQAGNSIVKNVLMAIFGQMFEGKEEVYKTL